MGAMSATGRRLGWAAVTGGVVMGRFGLVGWVHGLDVWG